MTHNDSSDEVQLPSPTAWPMVLALGVTLLITGMVTHWVVSVLGALLAVRSAVGWFFEVLPHEHHVAGPGPRRRDRDLQPPHQARAVADRRQGIASCCRLKPSASRAGIKGGIVGGIAMVFPATAFSLLRYHSLWYAVNLLAAGGFVSWAGQSNAFLAQFHLMGLLAALGIHALTSVLIGLLYGAMLPMFPRKPILTAGFIAPFLWTGILYPRSASSAPSSTSASTGPGS